MVSQLWNSSAINTEISSSLRLSRVYSKKRVLNTKRNQIFFKSRKVGIISTSLISTH